MDRIFEAYNGTMGAEFMHKTRERLHWICSQVWGSRVLDVGCSQGVVPLILARMGYAVDGLDINPEAIAFANEQLAKEPQDIQSKVTYAAADFGKFVLPKDRTYDVITMSEILEHLVRPQDFIRRAFLILPEKGRLIVTVPFGINDDPDHRQTFYLTSIYSLLHPFFEIASVKIFSGWIGLVGRRRAEETKEPPVIPLNLMRQAEEAFFKIERPLRDGTLAVRSQRQALKAEQDKLAENLRVAEQARLEAEARVAAADATPLRSELADVRGQLSASEGEKQALLTSLEVERKASAGLQDQVNMLKAMLQFATSRPQDNTQETRLLEYSQEVRDLRSALDQKRDEAIARAEQLGRQAGRIEALEAELAGVRTVKSALETKLRETEKLAEPLAQARDELALEKETLMARLAELESAHAEDQKAIDRIASERTRIDQELMLSRQELSESRSGLKSLRAQKDASDCAVRSAEQRVESLTADISGLRDRASAAEKKVAEAAGCLSGLEKRLTESENSCLLEKRAHQRFSSESYERGKELQRVRADWLKLQKICRRLDESRALAEAAYEKLAKSKLGRLTIRYWKLKDGKRGGEHSIRKSRSIRSALEEALRQLLSVKVKIPTCDAAKTAPASRLSPVASSAQKRSEARVVGLATAQWKDFKAEQIRVSRMIEPELRKSGEVAEADRLRTGIRIAEGQMTVGSPTSRAASRRIVEGRLKVATILDTFSDSCFGAECDLVRITPENWRDVLAKERPDMLLVESAWNGNGGSWQYLIGTYAGSTRDKLRELLQGCRELGIPTAFWNKEDPPHFDKFIEAASLFDHIFTTDENCIPKYRKMCGHDRVSALPFAAAPTIHNPIVEGPRDRDVCFAGTYYANRFEDRRKQMDVLLECAHGFNFDIYDRMFGNKNPGFENYLFPEKFRPYIRGKLDYADMLKAYRRYRFFLNTNSVVDSGTMFSRRVFELLACGTPVITTPSVGIQRFFGGIVDEITSVEDGRKRMSRLLADKVYYRDLQIRGIREVLGKHTYAIRLEQMARDLGFVYRRPTAVIAVFAVIGKSGSASVVETLGRQTVRPKLVVLRACDEKYSSDIRKAGFDVMISDRLDPVALSRAGVNFAVWMDFGLKYGKDYLLDASLNVQFERGHVSGMRATHEMEFRMAEDFMAPTVAVSSDRWKETAQVMDGLFLNGLKGVATLHGYNRPETEFSRG